MKTQKKNRITLLSKQYPISIFMPNIIPSHFRALAMNLLSTMLLAFPVISPPLTHARTHKHLLQLPANTNFWLNNRLQTDSTSTYLFSVGAGIVVAVSAAEYSIFIFHRAFARVRLVWTR